MASTIKCPTWLTKEGRAFFNRHVKHCRENGSLTDITVDSYAMLCRVWGLLVSTDPDEDSKASMKFVGLYKQFMVAAKPFGLMDAKSPAKKSKTIKDVIQEAMGATESQTISDR